MSRVRDTGNTASTPRWEVASTANWMCRTTRRSLAPEGVSHQCAGKWDAERPRGSPLPLRHASPWRLMSRVRDT
eukprot:gene4794-biopygen23513